MAQRRMFSLKVINSARFLKMPISSQLLYFHLGINADDDGIVEGYNVIKMIGCSEDDLKILVVKNFIIVLNEDLVSFITDWNEHNSIRPDRKIDSIYKELLLQIVSGVEVVEKRQRADVKKQLGQPMDNQWTEMDGIGKDRLGEVNKDIEKIWSLYPNKKGKAAAIKSIPKLLKSIGYEKLEKCIEKYIKENKKTDIKFIQYGSTFFNGGYMDYLDADTEIKPKLKIEVVEVPYEY